MSGEDLCSLEPSEFQSVSELAMHVATIMQAGLATGTLRGVGGRGVRGLNTYNNLIRPI